MLRRDCIVRTVLEGRLQGQRETKENAIELVIEEEEGNMDYAQLKELAQNRSNWHKGK